VYFARTARPLPEPTGEQSWRVPLEAGQRGWVETGLAYSPLWQAESAGKPSPVRRGKWGTLEVEILDGGGDISLHHAPGYAERAGALLTIASALLLGALYARAGLASHALSPHDRMK
jgi:uncharacterized membrane protein YfhO